MPATVITPPATALISIDEARRQVRFTTPDSDDYLKAVVEGVTDYLDGPSGRLGRAIGAQTIEESRSSFPGPHMGALDYPGLPIWCHHAHLFIVQTPPILELTSISYLDEAGEEQELEVSDLQFDASSIEPPAGGWPPTRRTLNGVRVRYQAGYEAIPSAIKQAALLMVGTLFANREAAPETAFSGAAAMLLSPYCKVV